MRDTCGAADQSDADHNYRLKRPWSPPQKRNPALADTSNRAEFVIGSVVNITETARTSQRAIAVSAALIDRTADLLLSNGRTDAAERLAHRAAEIRGVLV